MFRLALSVMAIWLFTAGGNALAAARTASANGNWNSSATWGGANPPTSADDATINSGVTVTVNTAGMVCNSLAFSGSTSQITFSGGDLTVSGNVNFTVGKIICNTSASTLYVGGTFTGPGTTFTPSTLLTVNNTGDSQTIPKLVGNYYYNLTLSGSGSPSLAVGNTHIDGNLTISGTVSATGPAAVVYLHGDLTIDNGASYTEGGTHDYHYYGNITNNGTYTGYGGVHYLSGTGKTISGTGPISISNYFYLEFTNSSYTNNGTLTCEYLSGAAGSCSFTNGTGGSLTLTNGNILAGCDTFVATATGNTVNYADEGAQTVRAVNYYNLTLSGSGTKTLNASTTTISGDLILSGTVSVSAVVGLTIGSVTLGSDATFTAGAYTHNVGGTWSYNGGTFTNTGSTINFNASGDQTIGGSQSSVFNNLTLSGSGNKTFSFSHGVSGTLSISGTAKALLTTGTSSTAGSLTLGGSGQSSGTYGSSTSAATNKSDTYFVVNTNGIVTAGCACSAGAWVGSTSSNWNTASNWCSNALPTSTDTVVIPNSASNWPTLTAGQTGHCASLTFAGSSSRLNMSGGDLAVSGKINFTSGVIVASTAASTLSVGGTFTGPGTTFTPSTYLTVNYTGVSQAIPHLQSDYYNLTLSGSGSPTIAATSDTINGNLTISGTVSATGPAAVAYLHGDLTIDSGASYSEGGNHDYHYYGNITNNGTYTGYGGVHYLRGTGKTISGTGPISISNYFYLELSASSYTNNGTLTCEYLTGAGGSCSFTNGTGGTLTLTNGTVNAACTTFTATATGNTVNYADTGDQTPRVVNYYNLKLSGSGYKIFPAGGLTIAKNLDISGTAVARLPTGSTSSAKTLSFQGVSQVSGSWGTTTSGAANKNGTYFQSGYNGILNVTCVSGYWTGTTSTDWNTDTNWCDGSVPTSSSDVTIPSGGNQPTIGAAGGQCRNITINSGATLTMGGAYALTVSGDWTNNGGTFAASTSTVTFNGTSQTIGGSGSTTFKNVSTSGSTNTGTGIGTTIGGNLSIGDGTTFTAAGYALTVTGTTTVGGGASGSLVVSSASGAKLFTGLVTIANGGTWNNSANSAVEFRGGITNSGTFTAGSGVHTFTTSSQALTGTLSIPSVTVTGVTLTSNNALTVGTALSGTGGLTQAANATLNLGGTSGITTLTATNTGNTVNYSGAGQTIFNTNYFHLTLSGSGTATLQSGTTTVSGNLTLGGGTISASAVTGLAIGGTVTLGNGTSFTAGAYTHNVGGDWANNGGTFTNTGSTIALNGGSAQSIGGSSGTAFNNLTISNSNGNVNLGVNTVANGALTFTQGKVITSSYTLSLGSSATTSGAGATKYVVGNLLRNISTGTSLSYDFPIGDSTNYDPVTVSFGSVSVAGTLTGSVTGGDSASIGTALIDGTRSVNHCWTLTNASTVFSNCSTTFNYGNGSDVDAGVTPSEFIAQLYSGGAWSTCTVSGTPSATSAMVSGMTILADFAIGNCKAPILTSFVSSIPTTDINPGQVVTYSVLVSNSGTGSATGVEVSNRITPYSCWSLDAYGSGVPFSLTQGSPASGLTLGTPVYSNDSGSTWTYTPVSGGGGAPAGYDATVTNWKIPMTGTMSPSGANFTINFKIRTN